MECIWKSRNSIGSWSGLFSDTMIPPGQVTNSVRSSFPMIMWCISLPDKRNSRIT